ncbi:MAG: glucosaminidase domain-containing protein [Vicinamibacterales bacterium]
MIAFRRHTVQIAAGVGLVWSLAACGSRSPVSPSPTPPGAVPIMGAARLSADQLVLWFGSRQPRPTGVYAATVPVEVLVRYFLDEGSAEGVTGDVAFVQSILETGWFRFRGIVPASANNFAGIGATDTNPAPAVFPDARTGVRAQVQHLRAYADPTALTCTVPPLRNPCVDPRFQLVVPKGKAPTWNELGNGNWATATTYGASILALYDEARAFSGTR